jgi:CBS-domain-containing membrane protein
MREYLQKFRGAGEKPLPRHSGRAIALATVGGCLAIGVIALLSQSLSIALLLGSLGSSSMLVFAFPEAPLSQPRNVVGGHFLSSLVGLAFFHVCGPHWWSVALAVGASIALMMLARTVHPPAGSNPLIVFLLQPGWDFAFFPTLAGAVLLVTVAVFYHNLTRSERWPKYW